jgi:RsiW-degrading membrane proteinase PrsW (M82 family)
MLELAFGTVFGNAAVPQKIALIVLVAAIAMTLVAAGFALRSGRRSGPWLRVVADLRVAGPALGLLLGAMNSFHMAQTIQRLPFDATAKQLAPGILEVSTFLGLGAVVGLVAIGAHLALGLAAARN